MTKSLVEHLGGQLNEAREMVYHVSVADIKDRDGLPVTVTMSVAKEHQAAFEKWLEKEQDNQFIHAEGGNVEY